MTPGESHNEWYTSIIAQIFTSLKVGCQKILENGQTSGNLEIENKWANMKSMTRKSHNHISRTITMRKKRLNNLASE